MKILAATVTSKGQITIPAQVRQELGLKPGSRVLFARNKSGYQMTGEKDPLNALKGFIAYHGPAIGVEDMDRAIDSELESRWSGSAR